MPIKPEENIQSTHASKQVAAFFYGSFIRPEIMALTGFQPKKTQVAILHGFDIVFDPHANIFRSDAHSICGVLVYPTHDELNKMYARDGVGVFLPEAVIVETMDNKLLPVMCYMPPEKGTQPADLAYVQHIVKAAKEHGFPSWYVDKLEQFHT